MRPDGLPGGVELGLLATQPPFGLGHLHALAGAQPDQVRFNYVDRSARASSGCGAIGLWAASDEDVFVGVVIEWLPGEAAVECLKLESCDIDQAEPLVLGCPPE